MSNLSRSEIRALCTKAARGAGYSWGMAEEAGFAASWLEAVGWPGAWLISRLLEETDGLGPEICRLPPDPASWAASTVCSLSLGTYLADSGWRPETTLPSSVGTLLVPAVAIPFLVGGSDDIRLSIGALQVIREGDVLRIAGNWSARCANDVEIGALVDANISAPESEPIAPSDPVPFLERLAQRTYVPETDLSRQRGAGEAN